MASKAASSIVRRAGSAPAGTFSPCAASPIRSHAIPSAVRQLHRCLRAAAFARSICADRRRHVQRQQRNARRLRIGIAIAAQRAVRSVIPAAIRAHALAETPCPHPRARAASVARLRATPAQKPEFRATWGSPTPPPRETTASPREFSLFPAVAAGACKLQLDSRPVWPFSQSIARRGVFGADCLLRQQCDQRDVTHVLSVHVGVAASSRRRARRPSAKTSARASKLVADPTCVTDWASRAKSRRFGPRTAPAVGPAAIAVLSAFQSSSFHQ